MLQCSTLGFGISPTPSSQVALFRGPCGVGAGCVCLAASVAVVAAASYVLRVIVMVLTTMMKKTH